MASLELVADPLWGHKCLAYHVQVQPDEATRNTLAELQKRIAPLLPIPLNLVPAGALHMSIVTLIPARSQAAGKNELWLRIRDEIRGEFDAQIRQAEPFALVFRRIDLMPDAIIVSTPEQPAIISDLRARAAAILERLGLQAPRYDRAHITLARYAASGRIEPDAIASIERDDLELCARFSRMRLVREVRYPSLDLEAI